MATKWLVDAVLLGTTSWTTSAGHQVTDHSYHRTAEEIQTSCSKSPLHACYNYHVTHLLPRDYVRMVDESRVKSFNDCTLQTDPLIRQCLPMDNARYTRMWLTSMAVLRSSVPDGRHVGKVVAKKDTSGTTCKYIPARRAKTSNHDAHAFMVHISKFSIGYLPPLLPLFALR